MSLLQIAVSDTGWTQDVAIQSTRALSYSSQLLAAYYNIMQSQLCIHVFQHKKLIIQLNHYWLQLLMVQ